MNYEFELKKIKRKYFRLRSIRCPALYNNKINFDYIGFRHFIRQGRKVRPLKDQIRRFLLFRHATRVIKSKLTKISETRIKKCIVFYSLIGKIRKKHFVKIIIIKTSSDKMSFLSIMNYKQKQNSGLPLF